MPYNTSAIPPRKEPTGQTQLPLSRVKKIISQDPDVRMCSNNAAFVITLAAEMFLQHLAEEANTQAKLERKPRRNIQYKDVAHAISHQDNLEFLEDIVPKTTPYKAIKATTKATRSRLRGEHASDPLAASSQGGAAPETNASLMMNGQGPSFTVPLRVDDRAADDPNEQLRLEMRQASGTTRDVDVRMAE